MKRLSLNLLTNVLLLLVGIVLIIFYTQNDVLRWVSVVMGALFLLPSLAYLASVAFRAAEQRRPIDMLGILPSVGGMCFGVIMMLKPHLFESVIILLMGILMLVMGLFHIIYLLLSWRTLGIKLWYVAAPVIVTICGVMVLASAGVRDNAALVTLLTGVSMLLFNFTSMQEYLAERKLRKSMAAEAPAAVPASAEVDAQPVAEAAQPAVTQADDADDYVSPEEQE